MDHLFFVILSIPILLMGVRYAFGLWIHMMPMPITRDYSFKPTVSVLLPCFNEGKDVYDTIKSICECGYDPNKLQVIAVDDRSADDSWQWIQLAAKEFPGVVALQNEQNSGKPKTLLNAFEHCTGEIILFIDSDCIFDPGCIDELVSCFSSEKVGVVGGRIAVANANDAIITRGQALIYYLIFHLSKTIQTAAKHVFCVSGALFAIRRNVYTQMHEKIEHRNWFGIPLQGGEDRFMTHQAMLNGYYTIVNTKAICRTKVPNKINTLFNQQLRWRRGTIRDWFFTLWRLDEHITKFGVLRTTYMILPRLMVFTFPFLYLHLFLTLGIVNFIMMKLMFVAIVACVLTVVNLISPKRDQIKDWVLVLGIPFWLIIDIVFITPLALLTLDNASWATRQVTT